MMITDIEDYFSKGCGRCKRFDSPDCSALRWNAGLRELRQICVDAGLDEVVKWGHPCYAYDGRNIVVIGAFRENFRISFFNAALMKDPQGVLVHAGPNTKHAGIMRFTTNAQVTEQHAIIRAYLLEAINYAQKGELPAKDESEPELPVELIEVLEDDLELAEAFDALTCGRRKSYVINLNTAKQSETRFKRIAKFRDKIIAGKGAQER